MSTTINVSSPAQGRQYTIGDLVPIRWSPIFTEYSVRTEVSLFKGSTQSSGFIKMLDSSDSLAFYNWDTYWEELESGNDYIIQVYAFDNGGTDMGIGQSDKFIISGSPPVTTTTTTTLGPGTTTTTTTLGSTTTTTTPAYPLAIVETIMMKKIGGTYVQVDSSPGSDSFQTKKNPFSSALSFGTIASGEEQIIVVALRIPDTLLVKNIRIGLVDAGGIPFRNDIFGVYSPNPNELSDLIVPTTYFQGITTDTEDYTISISNASNQISNYVYLSLNMPYNYYVQCGVIRYRWYFEFVN